MEKEKEALWNKIANEIHSDSSPVGIDAKKTHIMILAKLEEMHDEIKALKERIDRLD